MEADVEDIFAAVLRLQRVAGTRVAALLPYAVLRIPDTGRGPELRHPVLQGHGHSRALLHEEDAGHDADRVPLLREQQFQGLV